MARLIFIHGRAQERKDALQLKRAWIDAWRQGLAKSGLNLPLAEEDICIVYYGDTLDQLVAGMAAENVADVILRGAGDKLDSAEIEFLQAITDEIRAGCGISDAQVHELMEQIVIERGPLNKGWVLAVLRAIDKYLPWLGSEGLALFTRDVHQYLRNPVLRDVIENGARKAFEGDKPAVVVAHSLGTVVIYNLLRREGTSNRWNVPLLVTLGSPLGIAAVRNRLMPIKYPECVGHWLNALDSKDVVALYPLTPKHFDVTPEIENKTDVSNTTDNRHGISGYLDDAEVARRIYDAVKEK